MAQTCRSMQHFSESFPFSYYTHNHFGQYAKERINCYLSNKWDISCCIAKKASDCILYCIENSVANTINVAYMQCTMGVMPSSLQQPFCIRIGCSFYGITWYEINTYYRYTIIIYFYKRPSSVENSLIRYLFVHSISLHISLKFVCLQWFHFLF